MSTDLQKYSTENQLETIRRYADQRGYTIVRTFEDSGRSGLAIDDRDGLKALMLELQSGTADFQAILVYDVVSVCVLHSKTDATLAAGPATLADELSSRMGPQGCAGAKPAQRGAKMT